MAKNRLDTIEWLRKREAEKLNNKIVDIEVIGFIKELEGHIIRLSSELWIEKHK